MSEQVKAIMFEHLEMLADAAENCLDEYLESITMSMVATARFLTEDKNSKEK